MGTTGCGLLDGNGNGVGSDKTHSVVSNNGKGGAKLTCHAFGVPNDQQGAVHFNFANTGLLCSGALGATENWKITVSNFGDGTGDAVLQCRN